MSVQKYQRISPLAVSANISNQPRRDFWNSKRFVSIVRKHLNNWKPSTTKEYWHSLRDEVDRCNLQGNYAMDEHGEVVNTFKPWCLEPTVFPSNSDFRIELLGNPPISDFRPIRQRLEAFSEGVTYWFVELKRSHAKTAIEECFKNLVSEPAKTLLKSLIQISSMDSATAANYLLEVSRKGLNYQLPGKIARRHKHKDCGIAAFVNLAREIDRLLNELQKRVPNVSLSSKQQRVVVDIGLYNEKYDLNEIFDGQLSHITVSFNGKSCSLRGQKTIRFFISLFSRKPHSISFKKHHAIVYQGIEYKSADSGPPAAYKKLKQTLNDHLLKWLGRPPVGKDWIEQVPGEYRLTQQRITWQRKPHKEDPDTGYPEDAIGED